MTRKLMIQALSGIRADPKLVSAYRDPSRHYHTNAHIIACLTELERYKVLATHPDEIAVALWFHDAVYDTRRTDNEERSAAWAERYLMDAGLDSDVIARVSAMILATKTHHAGDSDTALMVDIDLHILGTPPPIFEVYDHAIRLEYEWVPKSEYRRRRAQVLRMFLQRECIYKTSMLHEQYETQARKNLRRKVAELTNT